MWNDEIDDIARDLTADSPRTDFKARVLARLDAAASRPRWLSKTPALVLASAAALVVVVAYLEIRRPEPSAETASAIPNQADPSRAWPDRTSPDPMTSPPRGTVAARDPDVTIARRSSPAPSSAPSPAGGPSEHLPPLEVAVDPIEPPAIGTARIAIAALPMPDRIVVDQVSIPQLVVRAFDAPVEDNP